MISTAKQPKDLWTADTQKLTSTGTGAVMLFRGAIGVVGVMDVVEGDGRCILLLLRCTVSSTMSEAGRRTDKQSEGWCEQLCEQSYLSIVARWKSISSAPLLDRSLYSFTNLEEKLFLYRLSRLVASTCLITQSAEA